MADLTHDELSPCRECDWKGQCAVGSRVHAFLKTGDWLAVDERAPCFPGRKRLEFRDPALRDLHREAMLP